MRIVSVEQRSPEWFQLRHGKITGSQAKGMLVERYANRWLETSVELKQAKNALASSMDEKESKKLETSVKRLEAKLFSEYEKYSRLKLPVGFWQLLSEQFTVWTPKLSVQQAMQRGVELEATNIELTLTQLHAWEYITDKEFEEAVREPGVWVNDELGIQVSPDATAGGSKPRWAIECKSISSHKHLEAFIKHLVVPQIDEDTHLYVFKQLFPDLQPGDASYFDCVPEDYKTQVLHYFMANPDLEVVFFAMFDDRFEHLLLQHFVLPVFREHIQGELESYQERLEHTREVLGTFAGFVGDWLETSDLEGLPY